MRTIAPARNLGNTREKGIQILIDDQPTSAIIKRISGSTLAGNRTEAVVASFQCRVDILAMGPRYLVERDKFGNLVNVTHRLIARSSVDKNGSAIDVKHGDIVEISGKPYTALYVNRVSYMTEAIIEQRQ